MGLLIVKKIFNNNVILTVNEDQHEIVVMGNGIAFQKKLGDKINEDLIDKRFFLDTEENIKKLSDLLNDISPKYLEIASDIIDYGMKEINTNLSKSIYMSLTDHLNFTIQRYNKGYEIGNSLIHEIRNLYPSEYKIGLYGVEILYERLKITLPEEEAGFIAMHFINAQQDSDMGQTVQSTKIIQGIINILQLFYKTTLDRESINFSRFVTHLRYLSYRIQNQELESPGEDKLFMQVKGKLSNCI